MYHQLYFISLFKNVFAQMRKKKQVFIQSFHIKREYKYDQ